MISNYFEVSDLCSIDLKHFNGIEDIDIENLLGGTNMEVKDGTNIYVENPPTGGICTDLSCTIM